MQSVFFYKLKNTTPTVAVFFCFLLFRSHPGVHAQRVNASVLVGMDQMCFNVPRLPHETHAVPARVVQKVPNHLHLSRILVFGGRHDLGRGWGGVGRVGEQR